MDKAFMDNRNKFRYIKEGHAIIRVSNEKKISSKLPVFYNPIMKINRDSSIMLIKALERKDISAAFPLAGTGVRGIRMFLELPKGMMGSLWMNDHDPEAVKNIKNNLKKNNMNSLIDKKIFVSEKDANKFIIEEKGFDYIDIDPFGSPNPFLDNSLRRISRKGILAITATDTAPLCGTYPSACIRKYWAKPLRNYFMHETGLRILIRKIQLVAAQYDRAAIPIFSYSKDHYFRIMFIIEKGKKKVDSIMKKHKIVWWDKKKLSFDIGDIKNNPSGRYEKIGPLWTGCLSDKTVLDSIMKGHKNKIHGKDNDNISKGKETERLMSLLMKEAGIISMFFYDTHEAARLAGCREPPKNDAIIRRIISEGFKASLTHFSPTGIKTDISSERFMNIIKKECKKQMKKKDEKTEK